MNGTDSFVCQVRVKSELPVEAKNFWESQLLWIHTAVSPCKIQFHLSF